jgi:hypothetical protein
MIAVVLGRIAEQPARAANFIRGSAASRPRKWWSFMKAPLVSQRLTAWIPYFCLAMPDRGI